MFERKIKTLLMFFITIAFSLSVFVFSRSYLAVFAVIVVFIFELRRYIFPTLFRLTDDGIVVKTFYKEKLHRWSRFQSVFIDKNGALLSPYKHRSILEKFRGFYVLFGANTSSGAKEYILSKY